MDPVSLPAYTPESAITLPRVNRPIAVYPGYSVMSQQDHWDEATRNLILRRVHDVPPIRFFGAQEARLLQAVVDRILPQDDRPPDRRIPIVPWIDQRCRYKLIDGYRYEDLPPEDVAWRQGLRGIDEAAQERYHREFVELDPDEQDAVLWAIGEGHPPGSIWQQLPAHRFWTAVLVHQIASIYYAHPIAWDEIGYGGPSYPRGYVALNHGLPEPWEVREVRLDASANQP